MRMWETVLTERDFVEVQILGGLEFALNLLKASLASLKDELSDFKASPKQLSFTITYTPEHCKKVVLGFELNGLKKETANTDLEIVMKKMLSLEKTFTENISSLKKELDEQIVKSAGYVIFPTCPFAIHEGIVNLTIGKANTSDPITSHNYSTDNISTMLNQRRYYFDNANNLNCLKYLKKCHTLRLVNADDATDFSPIAEMTSLKNLHIVYSTQTSTLTTIDWITKLQNLESVMFFNCKGLTIISPLTQLKKLKTIDIRGSGIQNTSMLSSSITIQR
jgi:hypothetical protein